MGKYTVSQDDLKVKIESYPIEVVRRMAECQIEQSGSIDMWVLQNRPNNAFIWRNTLEGSYFWQKIILDNCFEVFFERYPKAPQTEMAPSTLDPDNIISKIEQWVIDRNIHTQDPARQFNKTVEELGELAKGLNKGNEDQIKDGIGDVVVTLIAICLQKGYVFNDCLELAYNEIKDRKGKIIDGVFVKEQDLK